MSPEYVEHLADLADPDKLWLHSAIFGDPRAAWLTPNGADERPEGSA